MGNQNMDNPEKLPTYGTQDEHTKEKEKQTNKQTNKTKQKQNRCKKRKYNMSPLTNKWFIHS